jgi:hypothetical protein
VVESCGTTTPKNGRSTIAGSHNTPCCQHACDHIQWLHVAQHLQFLLHSASCCL